VLNGIIGTKIGGVLSSKHLRALEEATGVESTAAAISRLAKKYGDAAAGWAFTQASLRQRAAAKFDRASEMLFDRPGYEMASHEHVAAWRASRFPAGAPVLDMTCGIGGDLLALGGRGPVAGCDIDEARCELARHNADVFGVEALISCRDGRELLADFDYVLLDPARRTQERRRLKPEMFEPNPWDLIEELRAKRQAAIKLSPMLPDELLESFGGRTEFVSFRGECREALVWLGAEAGSGVGAVRCDDGEVLESCPSPDPASAPMRWIYEADPAAIRAHALGGFGLASLGDSPGYLTGDEDVRTPWLTQWECIWSGAWRKKVVQAELRSLGARVTIVKKRGIPDDPDQIRRQLKSGGDEAITLFLYRSGASSKAALCRKI
jgi:hypothetical protein